MDEEEKMLQELKSRMSKKQREDMKEIIAAELERRKSEKTMAPPREKSSVKSSQLSSGLEREHLADMYAGLEGDVRTLRLRKLEAQLAEAKKQESKYGKYIKRNQPSIRPGVMSGLVSAVAASGPAGNLRSILLMGSIVCLAGLKVVFSTGVVDATMGAGGRQSRQTENNLAAAQPAPKEEKAAQPSPLGPIPDLAQRTGNLSENEKQILISLDARRVELDRRRTALEQKEADLRNQSQALNERLAELRSLTTRLSEQRKERDARYEARLEQLANVYGSMVPQEAAPLIAKLDEPIALALMERMPGKRMGQILSVMEKDRAVQLTKRLTDRGKM